MARGQRITQLEPLDQRLHLMVTASEITAVDEWLATRGLRGRSEAVRQLIALGLAADAAGWTPEPAAKSKKATRKPST